MALQGAQHQARVCRVLGVLRHTGHSGAACAQHVRHARKHAMHSMRAMPSAHLVVVVEQRTSHQLHHAVPQVGALRAKLGQAGQGGGADLRTGGAERRGRADQTGGGHARHDWNSRGSIQEALWVAGPAIPAVAMPRQAATAPR